MMRQQRVICLVGKKGVCVISGRLPRFSAAVIDGSCLLPSAMSDVLLVRGHPPWSRKGRPARHRSVATNRSIEGGRGGPSLLAPGAPGATLRLRHPLRRVRVTFRLVANAVLMPYRHVPCSYRVIYKAASCYVASSLLQVETPCPQYRPGDASGSRPCGVCRVSLCQHLI
jgi:hypothetical protein